MRRRREPPLTFVIRLAVLSLFPATTAVAASPVEILISEVRKEDQEGSILIALSILNSNDHLEAVVLPNRIEAQVVQSGATSTVWLERYANMPGEVAIPSAGFYRAIYIMRSASGLDISGAAISIPSWSTRQVVVEPGIMAQPVPTQGEAIAQGSPPAFEENAIVRSKADRTSNNAFLTNLSAYEPVYAVYGPGTQTEARIQFSFKYQVFGTRNADRAEQSWRDGLHFGYTQRMYWDLSARSSPFRNIDFQPELFYLTPTRTFSNGTTLSGQAGVRHESNGRAGEDSRSLNTLYVGPMATLPLGNRYHLSVAPRVEVYVGDLSDNPDIRQYRGNLSLDMAIGKDDGLRLSTSTRFNFSSGKGAFNAEVSYPLQQVLGGGPNFYLIGQSFFGYGENLLDYDRHSTRFRFGIAIVR